MGVSFTGVLLTSAFAAMLAGCGGGAASMPRESTSGLNESQRATLIQTPALISSNNASGQLEYWPISPKGGNPPKIFSTYLGLHYTAMASDGPMLAISNEVSSQIVFYDVRTAAQRRIPDPYGVPFDIVMDKAETVYVEQGGTPVVIAVFRHGAATPTKLTCANVQLGVAIAVDDERDVFLAGYASPNPGVFEFAHGSNTCTELRLKPMASPAGVAVEPASDDLIVLDNPGACAGGQEGRMTIYPKPYRASTGRSVVLGGDCPYKLRLSGDSRIVFYGDTNRGNTGTYIRQSTYPEGHPMHAYYGGQPGGWTTIPNRLPN